MLRPSTFAYMTLIGMLVGCTTWHEVPLDRIVAEVAANDRIRVSTCMPVHDQIVHSFLIEAIDGDVLVGGGHRIRIADIVSLERAESHTLDLLKGVVLVPLAFVFLAAPFILPFL